MLLKVHKNCSYDKGYTIGTGQLKKVFNMQKEDFDLGREFALTFNVNNSLVTMKGSTLRRRGDTVRIGKKAIPFSILRQHDNERHFEINLIDVRKMTTKRKGKKIKKHRHH